MCKYIKSSFKEYKVKENLYIPTIIKTLNDEGFVEVKLENYLKSIDSNLIEMLPLLKTIPIYLKVLYPIFHLYENSIKVTNLRHEVEDRSLDDMFYDAEVVINESYKDTLYISTTLGRLIEKYYSIFFFIFSNFKEDNYGVYACGFPIYTDKSFVKNFAKHDKRWEEVKTYKVVGSKQLHEDLKLLPGIHTVLSKESEKHSTYNVPIDLEEYYDDNGELVENAPEEAVNFVYDVNLLNSAMKNQKIPSHYVLTELPCKTKEFYVVAFASTLDTLISDDLEFSKIRRSQNYSNELISQILKIKRNGKSV